MTVCTKHQQHGLSDEIEISIGCREPSGNFGPRFHKDDRSGKGNRMKQQLGMAVANVLYPAAPGLDQNNADALWSVIADDEKALCLKIAQAVLSEIRKPSPQMLTAAETDVDELLRAINSHDASDTTSVDIISTAFTAMIDDVVNQIRLQK